jgi:hypothetical protein
MALVMVVYLIHLTPLLVAKYLTNTAGLWERWHGPSNVRSVFGTLVEVGLTCAAVTVPILVPALTAAWGTRGYRLILEMRTDSPGTNVKRD